MYEENKGIKKVKDRYASKQIEGAVRGLAIGVGDIRERLINIYIYNLSVLRGNMMDEYFNHNKENIQSYKNIMNSLEKHIDKTNTSADQFIPLLSIDESIDIAIQICELNSLIESGLNLDKGE